MRRRLPLAILTAAVLIGAALGSAGAQTPTSSPVANSNDVSSLREQAADLTESIESLEAELGDLEEDALEIDQDIERLTSEIADIRQRIERARADRARREDEARSYAIQAFVGGVDNGIGTDARSMTEAASRRELATMLHGDRRELVDALKASGDDLREVSDELSDTSAQLSDRRQSLDVTRSRMEGTAAELRSTLRRVNGRVAQLVAAEQARREAQAAAAARAANAAARSGSASSRSAVANSASPGAAKPTGAAANGAPTTTGANRPGSNTPPPTNSGGAATTQPSAPPATTPPAPAPPPSSGGSAGQRAVNAAMTQLGVPYKWAGASPSSGFDCSGLVMWAYAQAGVSLPHSSRSLRSMTRQISEAELVPGDLVFGGSPVHHVGIYIGNGQMVHAPHTGDVVRTTGIYRSASPVSFGRL